jgi:hypothetical protein
MGPSVYFQMDVTIIGATWQPNTFLANFNYASTALVDFTQIVPKPNPIALSGMTAGLCPIFR